MVLAKTFPDLPEIGRLREICRAVAMIEAAVMPEWEYRYFSHNCAWGDGQEMASMRNGSGTDHHGVFCKAGAIFKGFDADDPLAREVERNGTPPEWIFRDVPEEFRFFLGEPAFMVDRTTFCAWRRNSDDAWNTSVNAPAGSPFGYMRLLRDDPVAFAKWASDYYEREVSQEAVQDVFNLAPISEDLVLALNPRITLEELAEDIREIGYPMAASRG